MNFFIFIAYILSLLRLPYAILPYLIKFTLFAILRNSFSKFWNHWVGQITRVFLEILNLIVTPQIIDILVVEESWFSVFLKLAFLSEFIRLLCEKGIMAINFMWQLVPHYRIAILLKRKTDKSMFRYYIRYHLLSDEQKIKKCLSRLKAKARLLKRKSTNAKLRYVSAFRVVSDNIPLRSGNVRNVAHGEIYIHKSWLNIPELLYGLALRRSPWIFDPRYLKRPFYYRSEANPLMTRFVLENANLIPMFTIYQFGHEIKSARYELFYKFFRWLKIELEKPVCEDGSNQFDTFAKKILQLNDDNFCHPLWTDEEVIQDLQGKTAFSTLEIAEKYTYPCVYVNEVLIKKL